MRIKTHLDNVLYLSSLQSDLSTQSPVLRLDLWPCSWLLTCSEVQWCYAGQICLSGRNKIMSDCCHAVSGMFEARHVLRQDKCRDDSVLDLSSLLLLNCTFLYNSDALWSSLLFQTVPEFNCLSTVSRFSIIICFIILSNMLNM